MSKTLITRVKGYIFNPVESFGQSRQDEPRAVLSYLIPLLLFDAIMTAIISFAESRLLPIAIPGIPGALTPAAMFASVLIGGAILILLFTAWVHLLVFLAGGRRGIFQTFKALTYGLTPSYLFHWIPVIGILFDLWSIIIMILGIRELQEISSGRALVVMMIAVMVPLFILILVVMYLFVAAASQTVPAAPYNLF
jgi:hypothetical protein